MTPVYSPIGSAPACPRSYAAEVASLETPLRVGTSCHLQLLHVLAIGVPRKRRSSSGFLKTRRTRLPRSGLVQRRLRRALRKRRGFDGLAMMVQEVIKKDPYSGHMFA